MNHDEAAIRAMWKRHEDDFRRARRADLRKRELAAIDAYIAERGVKRCPTRGKRRVPLMSTREKTR